MSIGYELKIKNFGPISEGFSNPANDDFFLISKCTVFIGEQGTGKSTVAKIASTFLWLEKDFIQKQTDYNNFSAKDFIQLCKNQKIHSYFSSDTYLCYRSNIFTFEYKDSSFYIMKTGVFFDYEGRKIMYIPSERNFISVIDEADSISGLPYSLKNTVEEFRKASYLIENQRKKLPLNGFEYSFDKASNAGFIYEEKTDSTVRLSASSSGLQSFVPMFMITDYLSSNVKNDFFENLKRFSIKDQTRAENIIRTRCDYDTEMAEEIIAKLRRACTTGLSNDITEHDSMILMAQLKSILNICFFNIVEEPEQNLFPFSQIKAIEILVKALNSNVRNSLFLTTHSPFILSTLNNFLYADKLHSKLISQDLTLDSRFFTAYLTQNGKIIDIFDRQNKMINTTVIDDCSTLLNQQFDKLYQSEVLS